MKGERPVSFTTFTSGSVTWSAPASLRGYPVDAHRPMVVVVAVRGGTQWEVPYASYVRDPTGWYSAGISGVLPDGWVEMPALGKRAVPVVSDGRGRTYVTSYGGGVARIIPGGTPGPWCGFQGHACLTRDDHTRVLRQARIDAYMRDGARGYEQYMLHMEAQEQAHQRIRLTEATGLDTERITRREQVIATAAEPDPAPPEPSWMDCSGCGMDSLVQPGQTRCKWCQQLSDLTPLTAGPVRRTSQGIFRVSPGAAAAVFIPLLWLLLLVIAR